MTLEDSSWSQKTGELPGAMGIMPNEGANPQPVQHLKNIKGLDENFVILLQIDHEIHHYARHIHEIVESLNKAGAQERIHVDLEDQQRWLDEHLRIVAHLNTGGDEPDELLRREVEGNIDQLLLAIQSILKTLADRTVEDASARETASCIMNTGETLPPCDCKLLMCS